MTLKKKKKIFGQLKGLFSFSLSETTSVRNSFNNIFIDVSEITFNQKLKCMDKRTRAANVTEFVQAVDDFSVYSGRLVFSAPLWKVYATEDWTSFEKAGVFMYR